MGEKIRDLSYFHVNGNEVAIELNEGYTKSYSPYDIHIQSNSTQFCITDKDFMRLVSCLSVSKAKFDTKGEK